MTNKAGAACPLTQMAQGVTQGLSPPHCSTWLASCSASGAASGLTSTRVPSGFRRRRLLTRRGSKGHSNPDSLIPVSTASGRPSGESAQFQMMDAAMFPPNVRKVRTTSGPLPSNETWRMKGLVETCSRAVLGQDQQAQELQKKCPVLGAVSMAQHATDQLGLRFAGPQCLLKGLKDVEIFKPPVLVLRFLQPL